MIARIYSAANGRDSAHRGQIGVIGRAAQATKGGATTKVDLCKVEGIWKILTIAP